MFAHYGRSETSYVCALAADTALFEHVQESGKSFQSLWRFPRYLEEGEFILLIERAAGKGLTDRELTLFVRCIYSDMIHFQVITENPDVFWANQQTQEQ